MKIRQVSPVHLLQRSQTFPNPAAWFIYFELKYLFNDLEGNFEVEIPLLPSVGNYPKNAHQDGNSEKKHIFPTKRQGDLYISFGEGN